MNAVVLTKMNVRLVVLVCARLGNNVSISMAVTDATVTKDTHDKVRNFIFAIIITGALFTGPSGSLLGTKPTLKPNFLRF